MSEFHNQTPRDQEDAMQRRVERLVRMSAGLDAFERDLGISTPELRLSGGQISRRGMPHRILRGAGAVAAVVVFGALIWIALPARVEQGTIAASTPDPAPSPHGDVGSSLARPIVQRYVALYRDDLDPDNRCAECWCVAQLAARGGDGRTVAELHEDELVQATLRSACVIDPTRVVIVGLTGPANDMPTSDAEALAMSLCLLKRQSAVDGAPIEQASLNCLPSSVEYCMTTWDK